MTESRILLAGLPSSGKSTYIGLLFMAIEAGAGPLRLAGFQGDFHYVNELSDRLSRCDEAIRTNVNVTDGFNAEIRSEEGELFDLRLPDYSGETWKTAMEAREWSTSVGEDVRESTGICLFIKVGSVVNDSTIRDARRNHNSLVEGSMADEREEDLTEAGPPVTTTQVALVDLLQVLVKQRSASGCRLSVVLSAFDLAGVLPPEEWIRLNLPLFHQFLRSNRDEIDARIFGASAQGGRFDNPDSRAELLERPILDRAFVRDGDGREVLIEAPILWASGARID